MQIPQTRTMALNHFSLMKAGFNHRTNLAPSKFKYWKAHVAPLLDMSRPYPYWLNTPIQSDNHHPATPKPHLCRLLNTPIKPVNHPSTTPKPHLSNP